MKKIELWFEFELLFITSSNLLFLKPFPGDKNDIASSIFVFPIPFFPVKITYLKFLISIFNFS